MRKLKVFPGISAYLLFKLIVLSLAFASCKDPVDSMLSDSVPIYTISFNANGGSGMVPSAQEVQGGSSITLPDGSGFSKSGYTFDGWNTDTSGAGTIYQPGDSFTPTTHITLYANWDADPPDNTPGNNNPGSNNPGNNNPGNNNPGNNNPGNNNPGNNDPGNNDPGNNDPGDNDPDDNDPDGSIDADDETPAPSPQNKKYTVTFNANQGKPAPSPQIINYGGKVKVPENITKKGYVFGGWFTDKAFAHQWNFANDTVTDHIILYAKWDENIPDSDDPDGDDTDGSINVPFTGPTEKNISISRTITNNLSKSGGGSITLTINENFDRYEWFVGKTNVATGKSVTLQADDTAFITGRNWITAVVFSGTGASAVPWSGEIEIKVTE